MQDSRLTLALDRAEPLPPAGLIAVFGPSADADLSGLPKERVLVVQGFRPDHDAWAARGYSVLPEVDGEFAAAVIFLPRARGLARAWVAEAAARVGSGGAIWIDGQKTDGVDSMLKELRGMVPVSEPFSKAHGKSFCFPSPGPGLFDPWVAQPLMPAPGFRTMPGVFSADGVDRGSAVLAEALPARLPARVADLGAGWGWLAAQILAREGVAEVHLIEADHTALACARANVTDPRARFHWADATRFVPDQKFDAVVTNPPFHTGRAADPALGAAFIRAAASMLKPDGRIWLVANRHLPYERVMAECFREVAEAGGDPGFKVLFASRPVASRRAASSP